MAPVNMRRFCFTLNNYEEHDLGAIEGGFADKAKYLIVGRESGASGTPHLQGFVNLKKPIRFNTLKKCLPRAHVEEAKGTDLQNKEYCSKQEVVLQVGEPQNQGKRNDLVSACDILRESKGDLRKLAREMPHVFVKYSRGFRDLANTSEYRDKRTWKTEVHVLVGPPGVGKSKIAAETCPDAFYKTRGQWWDGYNYEEDIIIDDFYGWLKHDELLRVCDRYPLRVPVKCGFVQFVAKRIYITSNVTVDKWYKYGNYNPDTLYRRFTTYKRWQEGEENFVDMPIKVNF